MPLERVPRLVEGPAAVAGLTVENGLADEIARDVQSPEALPLLAYMLAKLHHRCVHDKRLTLTAYRTLGDPAHNLNPVQNAVRLGADQAVDLRPAANANELAALRDVFVPHLVRLRLDDGRRLRQPALITDLPVEAERLWRALTEARLLSARTDGGAAVIEVTHEALFEAWPTLKAWLDEEQSFLADLARLRDAYEIWERGAKADRHQALLHGRLLTRARECLLKYPRRFLGHKMEPLRRFIAESAEAEDIERWRRAAEERKRRRLQRWLFGGGIAAVMTFAVLGGIAAWQYFEARQQAAVAAMRTLIPREAQRWQGEGVQHARVAGYRATYLFTRLIAGAAPETMDHRTRIFNPRLAALPEGCAKHDSDCHVIAIGRFTVEPN